MKIIVACGENGAMGFEKRIPWHIPDDLKRFRQLTTDAIVIMGRLTYESIVHFTKNKQGLPKRHNIVVSRSSEKFHDNQFGSLHAALESVKDSPKQIYVIGGAGLYEEAMRHRSCTHIEYTRVFLSPPFDVKFPAINPTFYEVAETSDIKEHDTIKYQFVTYVRRHAEYQYLDLLQSVMRSGEISNNRTAVSTLRRFGHSMRFDLQDSFPLLTTKEVFWRGIIEELLWMLNGRTSAKQLRNKRVKIWDGNGSRKFLDSIGLTDRKEDDLGPIYGFQWRHFGAAYKDCDTDYTDQGIDQLKQVINDIKTTPKSRRLIVSAWNPVDLDKMALPPCHVLYQFYCSNEKELSIMMYQRSCDMGLGVPFNISSYAALCCMVAHLTGMKPGELVYNMGDVHVYTNHLDALKEQLKRQPMSFPKLEIDASVEKLEDFEFEHFRLLNYTHHPKLEMQMVV